MNKLLLIVMKNWCFTSCQGNSVEERIAFLTNGVETIGYTFGKKDETSPPQLQAVKKLLEGLPWWRSGWESACRCRGHGFKPWSGTWSGRSHMPRSNWAREPQLLSLRVWSLCSATRKAAIVRGPRTAMKSGPRLPQLEKVLAQKRRPNRAKKKKKKKKQQMFKYNWCL